MFENLSGMYLAFLVDFYGFIMTILHLIWQHLLISFQVTTTYITTQLLNSVQWPNFLKHYFWTARASLQFAVACNYETQPSYKVRLVGYDCAL